MKWTIMETGPLALGRFNQVLLFLQNWVYTSRFKKVQSKDSLSLWQKFLRQNTARNRLKGREMQDGPQWRPQEREVRSCAWEKSGAGKLSEPRQRRICIIRGRRHVCSNREWTFAEHLLHTRHCAERFTFSIALSHHKRPIKQKMLCSFSSWGNGVSGRLNKLPRVTDKPDSNSHFSELSSLQALSPNTNETCSLEPEE